MVTLSGGPTAPFASQPELRPAASPGPVAPVVLVVEDDDDLRQMLVTLIGRKYTVFAASDGLAALDLLAQIPVPDAMVLDVMMPRVDGLTLGRKVKEDQRLHRVPILYLTAKNGALDVVAGINAGARHYVTKPFATASLLAHLEEMVTRRS
jgi:DNA-binding response OmpR family regulator